jgi:two-component system, OmpR family, sensor histidine kinase KdpD
MPDDRADAFLRMIRRSRHGRLKVYLGYSAGVGKTYQMLQEGHRLKRRGIDVVIGLLETHGRADIAELACGLEMVPRRRQEYRGIAVEEMDAEAILARRPEVALIDEMAHTNVPGSANAKRYEDVQDVLAAGIHVITTLNVQHLESLYDVVEGTVGVKVRERIPDAVLAEADEIVDVDLATGDLRKRIEEGKVYPAERAEAALANFFTAANLEKLRELTLRELASQIDLRRRDAPREGSASAAEQVMVCLSSRGPDSEKLLRYASRLAGKLNRNWYAVYVQTPSEDALTIDAGAQRLLSETLTLAKQLGAMVFTFKGEDIADTLIRFAREYRVGHIVVGRTCPRPLWKRLGRKRSVVGALLKRSENLAVTVLDTRGERPAASGPPEAGPDEGTSPAANAGPGLSRWLAARRILIWEEPVATETVLRALSASFGADDGIADGEALYEAVLKRESQGSTFFNEGVAFPHVRVPGLTAPAVALGLTRKGIPDVATEKPMAVVFLILSPEDRPNTQVELLALAGRAARDRALVRSLVCSSTGEEALEALRRAESSRRSPGI